jgi:aryl-alcohol dehydrogenase-like predicted oxidoreductase
MNFNKIALGSVQFGVKYGINNQNDVLSDKEVYEILQTAQDAGIDLIDTAHGYGDAEKKIGNFPKNEFRIISKLPFINDNYDSKWVEKNIDDSLRELKVDKLYGILLHRSSDLLLDFGNRLYDDLLKLKDKGKIDKIGISVYEMIELENLIPNYKFDIVQAPLNIFDRRLITSGWLKKLNELDVEIHVRSIFLQGLLLMKPENRPIKFKRWDLLFNQYDQWLLKNNLAPIEACCMFAMSINEISKVIVGIDNLSQLEEILSIKSGKNVTFPKSISSNDTDLLNPLSWLKF